MPDHPSKDELSGFVLGTLPADSTEVVAEHIEHCPPCQETIHELDAHKDTLLEFLRQPSPPPVDAVCRQAIEQVAAIAAGKAIPKAEAVSAPTAAAQPSVVGPAIGPVPSREQFLTALRASGAIEEDRW